MASGGQTKTKSQRTGTNSRSSSGKASSSNRRSPQKSGSGAKGRGGASSRKKKKRRQRRKKFLLVLLLIIIAVAAGVVAYRYLGNSEEAQTVKESEGSCAEFNTDGSVTVTSIESFEEDYYDSSELKEVIQEAVAQYNAGTGEDSVIQESFSVSNGTARLVLTYASTDDYVSFNETDLFWGTVQEAQDAGYDFSGIMSAVNRKNSSKILNQAGLDEIPDNEVIILTEQLDVVTSRKILYVSSNLSASDDTHASAVDTINEETPAIVILQ